MAIQLTQSALAGLPDTVARPAYDRSALTAGILHVGVGNFHRAHMAWYLDRLFAQGSDHSWALIGAGVRLGDAAMRERLATLNPKASARVANRLIEASDRHFWSPDAATLAALHAASDDLEDRLEGITAVAA